MKKVFYSRKPFLIAGVMFSLMTVYLMCHIGYYFYSNANAESVTEDLRGDGSVKEKQLTDSDLITKPFEQPFKKVNFKPLKKRNEDVVAWLKVGQVDIDIAVTQTTDNDYYLRHDIDKKLSKLGWVFADARSNTDYPGMNTVLYGHNIINNNMFGSLSGLLKATKKNREVYETIQFTTPNKQRVYQIVSMYITNFNDWQYIEQSFADEKAKRKFVSRMQQKNIVKAFSRNDLSVNDQFLTFSTCYGPAGTTKRLVVHARLVAEK